MSGKFKNSVALNKYGVSEISTIREKDRTRKEPNNLKIEEE